MGVIDLQETSPDVWKAKYRGNYGVYTVKVKIKDGKTVDFSCSCPSDYYPCKHIHIVEEAITRRVAKPSQKKGADKIKLEQVLKSLTQKELCDFIIKQAKNIPQLENNVLMEFVHKINNKGGDSHKTYAQIFRSALNKLSISDDGYYGDYDDEYEHGHEQGYSYDYHGGIDIDILGEWMDKARDCMGRKEYGEAILICKAYIEEYAAWYYKIDNNIAERINSDYQEMPFEILTEILSSEETYHKELYDFCKVEILKPKYRNMWMHDCFNELFMKTSIKVGSDDFIALQDKLLLDIDEKEPYAAQKIFGRKIKYYRECAQPDKAWDVIRENLSIESFREEWVKKLIADGELPEAKKLVDEFITANADKRNQSWYELKLRIAQKENDIQEIQRVSFHFIESRFDSQYYKIYKSTFTKKEWAEKAEELIQRYEQRSGSKWFSDSVANVLRAEKQVERLMEYVIKHLSPQNLVEYHTAFSGAFPEKTLDLFRHVVNIYAKHNLGREHYNHVVNLFKMMIKINGGSEIVEEMICQFRVLYKNRRAMMEIINKFMPASKESGHDAKKEPADCPEPLLLEL